jgi:PKD repeat protein
MIIRLKAPPYSKFLLIITLRFVCLFSLLASPIYSAPLVYSTYLGGSQDDYGLAIAIDSAGNAYITGWTDSPNFPVTSGSLRTTYNNSIDMFVSKLNATGSRAGIFHFFRGSGFNEGYGIAVDNTGQAYLTGLTNSPDFPVTTGAFDTIYNGAYPNSVAFVSKLDTTGSSLMYSTFLGGNRGDFGNGIAVDSVGDAYITGQALSANFPVTSNAFQTTNRDTTSGNVFVSKINTNLTGEASLVYSTFLGGKVNVLGGDEGYGIAVDTGGNAYLTGYASSTNFPVTTGAYDTINLGGIDVFVSELNPSGSALVYSTYLGVGQGYGIAVDNSGNAYITGYSQSIDYPVTAGAVQTTLNGFENFIVSKLNSNGSALVYSTFLGGSGTDYGSGIAVDTSGNAYLVGYASSTNFPVSEGSFGGGISHAVICKLNSNGTTLIYSTYLGGNVKDVGDGIALDAFGNAYLTGYTESSNFPVTQYAFQTTLLGSQNVFVSKVSFSAPSAEFYATPTIGTGLLVVSFTDASLNGPTYWNWNFGDGGTSTTQNPTHTYGLVSALTQYNVQLIAGNYFGASTITKTNYITEYPNQGILYSTFLGGSTENAGYGIAVDNAGNAYITGYTNSANFPVTAGTLETTYQGDVDAFVSKLNPSGTSLLYSTFLGGSGYDQSNGIAVDSAGNAYITGKTESSDFPILFNSFQNTNKDTTNGNAFVTKLNPTGSTLLYSTYLGGSANNNGDGGSAIAVDSFGNAYITGYTGSTDFPITPNAYQTSDRNPNYTIFVNKINTNSTGTASLVYSTYLGGDYVDDGNAIAVDNAGNAYITGYSYSTDFPVTSNAYQKQNYASEVTAFVSKINTNSSGTASLLYSTYLGGNYGDIGEGIAVDSAGNAYVTGRAYSADFPVTANAFQTINKDTISGNAFISKINTNSSGTASLVYSTYFGGSRGDAGVGIAIDSSSNAYITGYTRSTNFPVTVGAFQTANTGDDDAFVSKINTNLSGNSSLIYSTYLGGNSNDAGNGIAVDSAGNAYITGYTESNNFPVTQGAFQTTYNGSPDGFVSKLSLLPLVPPVAAFYATPTSGYSHLTVNFTDTSSDVEPLAWYWSFGDDGSDTTQNPTHIYTSPGEYSVFLIETNPYGSDTILKLNYIQVSPSPAVEDWMLYSGDMNSQIHPQDGIKKQE